MPTVKKIAVILCFLFVAFLATPSLIACFDDTANVSLVYSMGEEESSSKNQLSLEYNLEEMASNYESIHYLQELKNPGHFYDRDYPVIFLDVNSPPPRLVA